MRLPRVPEHLRATHELKMPGRMFIVGDASSAKDVWGAKEHLDEAFTFADASSASAQQEMLVLTLPYGIDKHRIRREQPQRLVEGVGLHGNYTTDAMFVGSRTRKVSPEGLVWIGRAMESGQINHTYYLDIGRIGVGGLGSTALAESPDLQVISDLRDVFTVVSGIDGSEIPLSEVNAVLAESHRQ